MYMKKILQNIWTNKIKQYKLYLKNSLMRNLQKK